MDLHGCGVLEGTAGGGCCRQDVVVVVVGGRRLPKGQKRFLASVC